MNKFLLGFTFLVSLTAQAQHRPEIIFESSIEISERPQWVLGDLVRLKHHSVAFLELIESYPISAEAISQGLDPQSIREIYKALVGMFPQVTDENPKLVLPQKIELKVVQGFSESFFRRKILNHLLVQCAPCEISIQKTQVPVKEIPKDWAVSWSELKLSPSILVPLHSSSPSALNSAFWVSLQIKIKRMALVARRNLNYEETVGDADFEEKMTEMTFSKEDPLGFEALKTYQKTARPIAKGRAIFPADLKKEHAALRGKTVKVMAGEAGFEISLSALAEESGHVGDIIRVKNVESKRIFSAVIVERGVVKIQ